MAPNTAGTQNKSRQSATPLKATPAKDAKKLQLKKAPTTRPRIFLSKNSDIIMSESGVIPAADIPIMIRPANSWGNESNVAHSADDAAKNAMEKTKMLRYEK